MSPSLWVTVEKLSQQLVWVLLFAILAPILGPRPYGLFAIVMIFIGYCELVTVDSAVEALIGMTNLEAGHLKTATAGNLAISIVAGIAVFALAPLLGRLFDYPELPPLFQALSVLPAISALTSAPIAVLKRRMEFRPLAIRSSLGLTIGGAVAVALALGGAGVWSLVAQIIVQRLAEVIILWITAGPAAGAGIGWSQRHYRELSTYAFHVFVSRSMNFAGGQLPRVIIGYFLGPVDLGLFTLASRFAETVAQIVILPPITVARVELRHYEPGGTALRAAFQRLMRGVAVLAFPMAIGAAVTVPLLYSIWLDQRWQPGIFDAQALLLTVLPLVVCYCSGATLLALNFPDLDAKVSMLQTVSNALCVLAAAPFGLDVVCLVMVARQILFLPYPALVVARACGIPLRIMVKALAVPFGLSLAMGLVVAAARDTPTALVGRSAALGGSVAVGGVSYAALLWIFAPEEAQRIVNRVIPRRVRALMARRRAPSGLAEQSAGVAPDA
jgi:O-antigen/teichoic acid export membrane protein